MRGRSACDIFQEVSTGAHWGRWECQLWWESQLQVVIIVEQHSWCHLKVVGRIATILKVVIRYLHTFEGRQLTHLHLKIFILNLN